jgi:outer membrane protein
MKQKLLMGAVVVFLIASVAELVFFFVYYPKIVFVDNNQLYKEFKGKSELEKKFIKEKESEQAYLDSLFLEVKSLDTKVKASTAKDPKLEQTFRDKKSAFDQLASEFNNRDKQLESKYLDQIWTQINQYVKEYGKEKGYRLILGAQGNGSLMYASDKADITKEAIEYCNKKYDGK